MFKKLIEAYRNRYYIEPVDLADSAETNRLHLIFISPFLFLFGIINLVVFLILYRHELSEHFITFFYYGIIIVLSLYMYLHSLFVKNAAREKAYCLKTIPFNIGFLIFLATGILAIIDNQPFNGLITCALTNIIALCIFSFSPLFFLVSQIIVICLIAGCIYDAFELTGLLNVILTAFLMFCMALYKCRTEKKIIMLLKKQKQNLEAKTFGTFTLLYNNSVIKFSRTKSEELLAYLIFKNGSSVKTKELITALYGKNADSSRYGASLRNLIVDIKHTLSELDIQNFYVTEYNNFRINPEVVKCDYYDFLADDSNAKKNFTGEFMSKFEWAQETTEFLKLKLIRK